MNNTRNEYLKPELELIKFVGDILCTVSNLAVGDSSDDNLGAF